MQILEKEADWLAAVIIMQPVDGAHASHFSSYAECCGFLRLTNKRSIFFWTSRDSSHVSQRHRKHISKYLGEVSLLVCRTPFSLLMSWALHGSGDLATLALPPHTKPKLAEARPLLLALGA